MISLPLLAAVLLGQDSGAQRYHVHGRILERTQGVGISSRPVAQAWVTVSALKKGAYADSLGQFEFSVKGRRGCYRLVASFVGYQPTFHDFSLASASEVDLGDIPLEQSPIPETYPVRSGDCVPQDSSLADWAGGFGEAEVTFVIPDEMVADSIWVLPFSGCRVGLKELEGFSVRGRTSTYRIPLAISDYLLLSPYEEYRVGDTVLCEFSAWISGQASGKTDAFIRVATSPHAVQPTQVRIELHPTQ